MPSSRDAHLPWIHKAVEALTKTVFRRESGAFPLSRLLIIEGSLQDRLRLGQRNHHSLLAISLVAIFSICFMASSPIPKTWFSPHTVNSSTPPILESLTFPCTTKPAFTLFEVRAFLFLTNNWDQILREVDMQALLD